VAFRGPVPALPGDGNYTSTIVVKAPDAQPRQLGLVGSFLPTALSQAGEGWVSIFPDALNPRLVLTAFAADPGQDGLGVNRGVPQSVYVLDVTGMKQLRTADGQPARLLLAPGQSATLPEGAGTVTFEGVRRFASFDIRSDPSGRWALGSALVALAGVTASLFVRRRRIWVRADVASPVAETPVVAQTPDVMEPTGAVEPLGARGRAVVEIAGLARGEDAGLAAEVKAVLAGAAQRKE
jgi:cytochrome c biogenesis protein